MSDYQVDYDSPWKEALERYFEAFMAFFFPQAHSDIDWARGYEFLDKELQQVVREAEAGRRLADKLVKVWRKNGTETWVLVHIEIQGQKDVDFAQRMYVYNYRLFDRYQRWVVSLAVLADEQINWRPDYYGYELWGCQTSLRFPIIKLLDYKTNWAVLEQSDNPFTIMIMAHLQAQATQYRPEQRLAWKVSLVKRLYERGYERQDVLELFRFIDWVMVLPEALEVDFEQTLLAYEEEQKMQYITQLERRAIQQGIEQGIEQGIIQEAQEAVLEVLRTRFEAVPQTIITKLQNIGNPTKLRLLLKQAVIVGSLEEFEQMIVEAQQQVDKTQDLEDSVNPRASE